MYVLTLLSVANVLLSDLFLQKPQPDLINYFRLEYLGEELVEIVALGKKNCVQIIRSCST